MDLHNDESAKDMSDEQTMDALVKAHRQVDAIIRLVSIARRDVRTDRLFSKVTAAEKFRDIEERARELERTLELMTRDARIAATRVPAHG